MNVQPSDWQVEVFFDGDCPLCKREISLLQKLDRKHRVRFTDISDPAFVPGDVGITMDALMERIHGRLPDGEWIEGVEVFRHLYSAIGLGRLVPISRLPGIRGLLDWSYRLFARNRLRWTGRCSDSCDMSSSRHDTDPSSEPAA